MFSIILPVIRPSFRILPTIQSVLSQNPSLFELIIVYTPSPSDHYGKSLLDELSLSQPNIIVLESPTKGIPAAWNLAISKASSDWLIFLGDTDIFANDSVLQTFADAISNPTNANYNHLSISACRAGIRLGSTPRTKSFWLRPTHLHVGSVFHRSLFDSYFFPANLRICADFDHYISIKNRLHSLHISSVSYVIGDNGLSRTRPFRTAFEDFTVLLNHGYHVLSFFYPSTILVSASYQSFRRWVLSLL